MVNDNDLIYERLNQLEIAVRAPESRSKEMLRLLGECNPYPVGRERFEAARNGLPIPKPPPPSGKSNHFLTTEEMTQKTLECMLKHLGDGKGI